MKRFLLPLVFVLTWCVLLPAAEVRHALIMGVWDYSDPKFQPLPGIEADVTRMAARLRELGFSAKVVTNPTLGQAKDAVDDFGATLKAAGSSGVGLFYFSGHGTENDGKNYLIPRGTRITTRGDLDDEALSAQRVLTRMEEAGNGVNLVFLDCCRNAMTKGSGDLAPMKATGTFIGFATASANVAGAGDQGSAYTTALLENLGTEGVSITDMHTNVTRRVKELTGGVQTPFQYSGLDHVFYMVSGTPVPGPTTADGGQRMPATPVLRPSPVKTPTRFNAAPLDARPAADQLIRGVKSFVRQKPDALPSTEPGIDFRFASVESPARLVFRAIPPNYPLCVGVRFPELGRFCGLPESFYNAIKDAYDESGDELLPGWVLQTTMYDFDDDGNPELVVALNKWDAQKRMWDLDMLLRVLVYTFHAPAQEADLDREENWHLAGEMQGQFVVELSEDELFLPIGSQGTGNFYIYRGGEFIENNGTVSKSAGPRQPVQVPANATGHAPQLQAAMPAQGSPGRSGRDDEMLQRLRSAAVEYVASGASPSSIERELAPYAENVSYYDEGMKSLDQIRRDIAGLRARWPERIYTVQGVSEMEVDAAADRGVAVVNYSYQLVNGTKKRTGSASTRITIRSLSSNPKVIAVREEKVESRK